MNGSAPQPVPSTEDTPSPDLRDVGLEGFAPYLLNRISGRYNADMAATLREHGLTTPQMRALAVLAVHPGLTINELAVYAIMEQSTMSRTLDAMVDARLVVREPSREDGRVRVVSLTRAGMKAFDSVWPLMRQAEERLLASLAPAERQVFMSALRRILDGGAGT